MNDSLRRWRRRWAAWQMNTAKARVRPILVLAMGLSLTFAAVAEAPDRTPPRASSESGFLGLAPAYSGMNITVVVMRGVGWSANEVGRVLLEAGQIYARECHFTLKIEGIHYIDVDARLHRLDRALQEQLLADLPGIGRPSVYFIGSSSGAETAYAYLQDTVSPSQGTAWLTRQVPARCRGSLLAHEIGHIALAATRHSAEPGNLMGDSCRYSNISNDAVNSELNQRQCRTLWRRYAH